MTGTIHLFSHSFLNTKYLPNHIRLIMKIKIEQIFGKNENSSPQMNPFWFFINEFMI